MPSKVRAAVIERTSVKAFDGSSSSSSSSSVGRLVQIRLSGVRVCSVIITKNKQRTAINGRCVAAAVQSRTLPLRLSQTDGVTPLYKLKQQRRRQSGQQQLTATVEHRTSNRELKIPLLQLHYRKYTVVVVVVVVVVVYIAAHYLSHRQRD